MSLCPPSFSAQLPSDKSSFSRAVTALLERSVASRLRLTASLLATASLRFPSVSKELRRGRRGSHAVGLGLDAERLVSLSTMHEVLAEVTRPGELDALRTGELDDASLLTVVFSAKESLYKCLRHVVGHYFDFHDATIVSVNHAKQTFIMELGELGAIPHARMTGRFVIAFGLVHTSIVLPSSC
jgi:phosphopantetheinyl transferase (holo-ACP synthase)